MHEIACKRAGNDLLKCNIPVSSGLVGFLGQQYDVTGTVDSVYSLLSDYSIAINSQFGRSYTTGIYLDPITFLLSNMRPDKTWMKAISLIWNDPICSKHHNFVVTTENNSLTAACGKRRNRVCRSEERRVMKKYR